LFYTDNTPCHVGDVVLYYAEYFIVKCKSNDQLLIWKFDVSSFTVLPHKSRYPQASNVILQHSYSGGKEVGTYLNWLRDRFRTVIEPPLDSKEKCGQEQLSPSSPESVSDATHKSIDKGTDEIEDLVCLLKDKMNLIGKDEILYGDVKVQLVKQRKKLVLPLKNPKEILKKLMKLFVYGWIPGNMMKLTMRRNLFGQNILRTIWK